MKNETVYDQISRIASQTPDKTAVQQSDKSISYKMLEMSTNQLANLLTTNIAENKNIVTILENSVELIQAAVGIMKAGCVFVPVDVSYPESRIRMMIEKVEAAWVMTTLRHLDHLQRLFGEGLEHIHIILMDEKVPTQIDANLKLYYSKDYLDGALLWERNPYSYIYFTSGSTGTPKAILGKHRSLKHFIDWEIKEFQIDENCVGSQLTSVSFDPFLRDIFVPLCAGGTLFIPQNRDILFSPSALKQWISTNQITIIHIIPTLFRVLMDEVRDESSFSSLQYVFLAGELLRGHDVKKFLSLFGKRIELVNLYGPTETTLAKVFYRIQPEDGERLTIPIGKPIDSTQLLILDSDMQISPLGNIGEIYIRTPYISAGYYKDKALNETVFIKNPFNNNKHDILYKTGDRGKALPSGDIEVIGRVDNQIKINGVRIEPEEIENRILSYPNIKQAVVVVKDSVANEGMLCAYLIADNEVSVQNIKQYLRKELPDTMIPSHVLLLDQLPLLPNGKIDRQSLPNPTISLSLEADYEAPRNEVEEKLITIWEKTLQISGIGRNHDIFKIGGNSINSLKIISSIQKEFAIELSLGDLFLNPILSDLAENIRREEEFSKLECVVRLNQISKDKPNFFILHTIDGHVFGYKEFAKLLEKDFNIYGVQAKGIAKECLLPNNMQELIAYYLYEIKKIQPEGPYLMGGHCFGNFFGYDLARLMEDNGDEIKTFIMFDEQVWGNDQQLEGVAVKSFISRPFKAIRRMLLMSIRRERNAWIYPYYLRHAKKGERVLSTETTILASFRHLQKNYKFGPKINAPIFVIRAKESVWERCTEEYWRKMTRGKVNILETKGDHWNLFDETYVHQLVEVVRQGLQMTSKP